MMGKKIIIEKKTHGYGSTLDMDPDPLLFKFGSEDPDPLLFKFGSEDPDPLFRKG